MSEGQASGEVLNSWKEIACYLNRGVRTAQRWEAELALPVRRPYGRRRSAVIAMRSEIDHWLNGCPLAVLEQNVLEDSTGQRNEPLLNSQDSQPKVSNLILRSRLLRSDLARSQEEFRHTLNRLIASLQTVAHQRTGGLSAQSKAA